MHLKYFFEILSLSKSANTTKYRFLWYKNSSTNAAKYSTNRLIQNFVLRHTDLYPIVCVQCCLYCIQNWSLTSSLKCSSYRIFYKIVYRTRPTSNFQSKLQSNLNCVISHLNYRARLSVVPLLLRIVNPRQVIPLEARLEPRLGMAISGLLEKQWTVGYNLISSRLAARKNVYFLNRFRGWMESNIFVIIQN